LSEKEQGDLFQRDRRLLLDAAPAAAFGKCHRIRAL
jgi:hypothetical protein